MELEKCGFAVAGESTTKSKLECFAVFFLPSRDLVCIPVLTTFLCLTLLAYHKEKPKFQGGGGY